MQMGFFVSGSPLDTEFRLFRTKHHDSVPLLTYSAFACYRAVLVGRLYYRNDLLVTSKAGLPSQFFEECRTNDAALAIGAYLQCSHQGLARLEGDFALVVWDGKENQLVGCRDPFGGYPLFWVKHDGVVALSTMLNPLLDLLSRRSINVEHLADFIISATAGNERAGEECAYEQVHRVLPGNVVSLNVCTGRVIRNVYWKWLDRIVDPGTSRLEDIALQYRKLLHQAVRERIRGPTAAHLSGGMDSTSIFLIALECIHSGVGEPPLHALSLVYERLPELSRERPYIESVLNAGTRGLVAHRIVADDLLDFDSFDDPPFHDEPWAGLRCVETERALTGVAIESGAGTILTGRGGDDLLVMLPYYLADLLRTGRFRSAWKESCKWGRTSGMSPWRVLYPFGIANLFPAWRQSLVGRMLVSGTQRRLRRQDEWSIPPWIYPSFARQYSLRARAFENAQRIYRRCGSTPLSISLDSVERRAGDVYRWTLAAPYGVSMSHPFLDPRVVCFSLGMQTRLTPCPGQVKPVLAEAMRDVLPENIRSRRDKRSFNQVYYLGLSRNLSRLQAMIMSAPIDDLGMIDKGTLIRGLQEAALGVADPRRLQGLNLTLSLIRWLSMQAEWHGRPRYWSQIVWANSKRLRENGLSNTAS